MLHRGQAAMSLGETLLGAGENLAAADAFSSVVGRLDNSNYGPVIPTNCPRAACVTSPLPCDMLLQLNTFPLPPRRLRLTPDVVARLFPTASR